MTFVDVDEFKRSRFQEIEQRTQVVLSRGFTYLGVTVSLSVDRVAFYQGLQGLGNLGSINIEAADPRNPH